MESVSVVEKLLDPMFRNFWWRLSNAKYFIEEASAQASCALYHYFNPSKNMRVLNVIL